MKGEIEVLKENLHASPTEEDIARKNQELFQLKNELNHKEIELKK